MDGIADVVLKETRQGKTVIAAILDVCYPAERAPTATTASCHPRGQRPQPDRHDPEPGDKLPVTVNLTRKPNGDNFEFTGQISVGQTVTELTSTENSDLSEKEFKEHQTTEDGITACPKDFTEVSPESIGVRIKLRRGVDFLKSLKGQELEIALNSLSVSCDAMRSGEQTMRLTVDPERAAALIANANASPGVVAAGWTSGIMDMERTVRFPAADWREGDKINSEKLAAAIAGALAKTLPATSCRRHGTPIPAN